MDNYFNFFYLLAAGLLLILLATYNYRRFYKTKIIASFFADTEKHIFLLAKTGKYTVEVIGAELVNKISITVINLRDNKKADIYQALLRHRGIKNSKITEDYCYFIANQAGDYSISINNRKTASPHLSFIIKEYTSTFSFIAMLLCAILGAMALLITIFFALSYFRVIPKMTANF
ncbi:hypothetical protein [Flavobacterium subsaxonicum]|uniref:Uncharacterized protein n=1 Tax=Flavobacterium subsaxonicum WB 4.1-42 = DSM 21790 TaxID=1121898 RepID=A0A0A2MIS0_9FLAO|nr:hypothetical protein [Flavobacterium subsaxonicum]KGO92154.1 hypothetical protein Q766_14805 [Flavobacterium subsaxonicum WB 4.1-42 = DSM 21790]